MLPRCTSRTRIDRFIALSLALQARLEALERQVKSRKEEKKAPAADVAGMSGRAGTPSSGSMAEWKEGALFPEGFDQMPLDKKINEVSSAGATHHDRNLQRDTDRLPLRSPPRSCTWGRGDSSTGASSWHG